MTTILGASGFVGSHLVVELQRRGEEVYAPLRNEKLVDKNLGNVIYCVGLTADFRSKPYETIEAHVCKLKHVLEQCDFSSLTYLSSTRIYIHNDINTSVNENSPLSIQTDDPADLFNASKLTGELLSLCSGRNVKIARLSNVYGNDFKSENFITSIVKDAVIKGKIVLFSSADSAKDYISIEDVTDLLIDIAQRGKQRIYNVASGINITNDQIIKVISANTKCQFEFSSNAPIVAFPVISVERIKEEFGYFHRSTLLDSLPAIISALTHQMKKI